MRANAAGPLSSASAARRLSLGTAAPGPCCRAGRLSGVSAGPSPVRLQAPSPGSVTRCTLLAICPLSQPPPLKPQCRPRPSPAWLTDVALARSSRVIEAALCPAGHPSGRAVWTEENDWRDRWPLGSLVASHASLWAVCDVEQCGRSPTRMGRVASRSWTHRAEQRHSLS